MPGLLELTALAEPTHFWFHGFRGAVAPALREVAAGRRDLRILDCGCGTGYNLKHLLMPYGQAFAFDLSTDAMPRARATGRPLVRANVEQIPFASATFDLVTSFDVIQSVPDDNRALGEMARVLKPGGHAVLNVTALDFLRGDHSDVWGERRRYTRESAGRLVQGAGLQLVRASYVFGSILPIILTVRLAQRAMRAVREPRGDEDLAVPPSVINSTLTWLLRGEAAVASRVAIPFGSSLLIVARKPASGGAA